MPLDRSLVAKVRRLDQYDLRRLMILARGLLLDADDVLEDSEPADPTGLAHPVSADTLAATPPAPSSAGLDVAGRRVSYRQEHVRCGKAGCTRCPHGPYWYGYWKEGGRTRSQYIGRELVGKPLEPFDPPHRPDRDADGA